MSIYKATVPQFVKVLTSVDAWLEKAAAHAKAKSFDVNVLASARLAPDQYPLVRQVQSLCDTAKLSSARLSGKEAPKHPDTEQTIDELRARIASVREWIATLKEADFEGSATRGIELSFMPGKVISGGDYLNEFALPNFYFHVTTAYAILRHNGVELGKRDFLGSLNFKDK